MAKNNDVKLQKFFMEFQGKSGDFFQYETKSITGEGLDEIEFPFHTDSYMPDYIKVKLFTRDTSYETIEDYEKVQFLLMEEENSADNKENRKWKKNSVVLKNLPENYFKNPDNDEQEFPKFIYSDITETDLFGYPPILSSDLASDKKGIWSKNGFRKFELTITDIPVSIKDASDREVKVSLFWHTIDSTELKKNLFEEEVRYDKEKDKFYAYINTNQLGEALVQNNINSNNPRIFGRFELHNILQDRKVVYSFPIMICLLNTEVKNGENEYLQNSIVSIDFGTSSTCAAVKGVGLNRLITLSGKFNTFESVEEKITNVDDDKEEDNKETDNQECDEREQNNIYENPTNLMIYNWDEVFNQWNSNNQNCPFFIKKNDEIDERMADYDSGYTVLGEYQKVDEEDGPRKMEAIITQLKMIPYLLSKGKEKKFIPYLGKNRSTIEVVASVDEESPVKFNTIAFYGYLLGRAINNPAEGKLYKKYHITYPAKFNKELRDIICESLAYGIKRALPQPIRVGKNSENRDLIEVNMIYSEPEACVGAFVGKQLKLQGKKAKLFAVYDLGGGTMDFAFGMLREAEGEELEQAEQVIKIFGIDGNESFGGEKLIHQLAYHIYINNKESMEKNKIKFILPEGEHNPKGFDGLISQGDKISDINVNIFKEKLARPLFKWPGSADSKLTSIPGIEAEAADTLKLNLKDVNEEDQEVLISVDGVDDFLKRKIGESVSDFKAALITNFENNKDVLEKYEVKFDKKNIDVEIFLGGNASKQHFVRELLAKNFSEEKIHFIGENQNDDSKSDEYCVNAKTAVAFGQLSLGNYYIDRPEDGLPPFEYNICFINADEEVVKVIGKNERSKKWFKANRIDKESGMTNLCYTKSPTCDRDSLVPLQHEIHNLEECIKRLQLTLYIRVNNENTVEYRMGKNTEPPDVDEPVNRDMLIRLG